jgi:hypothetical protein
MDNYTIHVEWTDGKSTDYGYYSLDLAVNHFDGFKMSDVVKSLALVDNETSNLLDHYDSTIVSQGTPQSGGLQPDGRQNREDQSTRA